MLLATAPSREGLLISIEKFYCGEKMSITDAGDVVRLSDGSVLASVKVTRYGKRWKFEGKE